MFNGQLFDFQQKHVDNLLKKCASAEEMVLYAPTGSGKTVMACKFIDEYLDENPNTVFLWLCPGAGSLQKQSQESFDELISGIESGDVYDYINEVDPKSKVYFINWDKINKSSNVVLREGEQKDFFARVRFCHSNKIKIFMLIDEEHKYAETANTYVDLIGPIHTLRISATPISRAHHTEIVLDDEVIAAGLIASGISINEGVSQALQQNNNYDDDLMLIDLADKKRKEILDEYNRRGLNIRPLVLIQFPNGRDEWIERIKEKLDNLGYGESSGLVTSWFTGEHPDDVEELKKLDGQYAFLLFKQAIATGWDCPRAKILVKLREGGTERFNIQTVGRVRRSPTRVHYGDSLIDNCYVYTLDEKFNEGLTLSLNDSFYNYNYKKKPQCYLDTPLTKESLDGSDISTINAKAVVTTIRKYILQEYDLNHDGKLDKTELESMGLTFGTVLKTHAIEGVARTTQDMLSLNRIFGGEHEIDNKHDGFIIRDAKRRFASALGGIDEQISNNALKILFGPLEKQLSLLSEEELRFENDNKLIDWFDLREFNAFLVNNKERLIKVFSKVSEDEIAEIEPANIITDLWNLPKNQYYKQHKQLVADMYYESNAFEKYGNNITIKPNRSESEIAFEFWCEHNDKVEWYYKNGDKGSEFFSFVYRKALRRNNTYPDYILKMKSGDVWIIEAKGGEQANGESNNIDSYAKRKFEAMKEYSERYPNIKWGFVRPISMNLYISNTEWSEDMADRNIWKPIDNVVI